MKPTDLSWRGCSLHSGLKQGAGFAPTFRPVRIGSVNIFETRTIGKRLLEVFGLLWISLFVFFVHWAICLLLWKRILVSGLCMDIMKCSLYLQLNETLSSSRGSEMMWRKERQCIDTLFPWTWILVCRFCIYCAPKAGRIEHFVLWASKCLRF